MVQQGVSPAAVLDSFRQLLRTLHAARDSRVEPWYDCPMTIPQWRAFSLIAASDRGLSSRELAASLGVGPSAITPLVDRLVDYGFVRRHEDLRDRRIARLQATDSGQALLERMQDGKDDAVAAALASLSPDQLEFVSAALDVLRTAVQRQKELTV